VIQQAMPDEALLERQAWEDPFALLSIDWR